MEVENYVWKIYFTIRRNLATSWSSIFSYRNWQFDWRDTTDIEVPDRSWLMRYVRRTIRPWSAHRADADLRPRTADSRREGCTGWRRTPRYRLVSRTAPSSALPGWDSRAFPRNLFTNHVTWFISTRRTMRGRPACEGTEGIRFEIMFRGVNHFLAFVEHHIYFFPLSRLIFVLTDHETGTVSDRVWLCDRDRIDTDIISLLNVDNSLTRISSRFLHFSLISRKWMRIKNSRWSVQRSREGLSVQS